MTREQAMQEAWMKQVFAKPLGHASEIATAGADAERARVVAWLRGDIKAAHDIGINLADAIERGEHWRGE